jgi:plastocyanin
MRSVGPFAMRKEDKPHESRMVRSVHGSFEFVKEEYPLRIDFQATSSTDNLHLLSIAAMSRRTLLRGLGALGAVAVAGARISGAAGQGATHEAATPQIGLRSDGSRLWRVQVAGGSMDDGIELMGFFPGEFTINAGDAIFFDFSQGMPEVPHTVSFLAGQPTPDLVVPEPTSGTPAAGTEVAENPRLMFNPEVAFPQGAETVDGTGVVSSGLNILFQPGTSYVLAFPTPGTYAYVDLVFPMAATGTVTVLDRGAALPMTQEDYDQATAEQQAPLIGRGKTQIRQYDQPSPAPVGDGTNRWEVTTGVTDGSVEVAAFVPQRLQIKAGDTVRWPLQHSTLELHTATFAGTEAPPELILVEPQEQGPPRLIPELVAAVGGQVYQGGELANTGFLSTRFPFPHTAELTFAEPGEYPYFCAIHGSPNQGMRGTIVVE